MWRGVLEVMLDFDPIDMKFGIQVEFDASKDYPKFGCDKLISLPVKALSLIHISEPTRPY